METGLMGWSETKYDEVLEAQQAEIDTLRAEIERLREERDNAIDAEKIALLKIGEEIERLREHLKRGQTLINEMDQRMPEQATEDADGWINSYRIPVGPWHRILGWARGGW